MTMNGKEKGKQIAGKATADKGKRGYDDDKTGGGRKRKNPGVIQFFEDEADDFDDSDDSEDSNFSDDSFEDEFETLSTTRNESSKGQSSLPFMPKVELVDEEEYDRMMEERFKDGSRFAHFAGDDYDDKPMEPNSFHPASREPTPTIWKVKCTVGRERLSAFCLMQKFVHLKSLGTKLQIISAFAVDHMKGFVYIEAEKQCEINEACQGISGIYVTRVQPVPKSEVFHMFSFRSRNPEITVGMWARVKSGNYKGDLGQVMAVNDTRTKVTVKLIPRIDLQALAAKFGGGYSRQKIAASAPRLISSSELEEFKSLIQIKRDRDTGKVFEVLDGMMLKDGYVYKKVSPDSLSLWGVVPTEEEQLKFGHSENNESNDLEWLSQIYGDKKKQRVIRAEKGDGKGESSSGSGVVNGFELYDLVCFRQKDFGVIIGMDKDDTYKILKESSEGPIAVAVEKRLIKSALLDLKLTARDHHGKTVLVEDHVRIVKGPSEGKQGIVKHIYRGIIFLYDGSEEENGGYFTAKANMCEKIKLAIGGGKDSEPGPLVFDDQPSSPRSPLSPEKPWQARENKREFNNGDKDSLFTIGQTLRIRIGPLKGYLCRVTGIRRADVTVKLDSQQKFLTVKCEHLSEVQGKSTAMPTSGDPDSSLSKPFDFLGTEGSSGGWLDAAGTSSGGGGWNVGGGGPSTGGGGWNVGGTAAETTEGGGWNAGGGGGTTTEAGGWNATAGGGGTSTADGEWNAGGSGSSTGGGTWNAGGTSTEAAGGGGWKTGGTSAETTEGGGWNTGGGGKSTEGNGWNVGGKTTETTEGGGWNVGGGSTSAGGGGWKTGGTSAETTEGGGKPTGGNGWNVGGKPTETTEGGGWNVGGSSTAAAGGWKTGGTSAETSEGGGWTAGGGGKSTGGNGWNVGGKPTETTEGGVWNVGGSGTSTGGGGWKTGGISAETTEGGGWNAGGLPAERGSRSNHSAPSCLMPESTSNAFSSTGNDLIGCPTATATQDTTWDTKNTSTQKSSWGAAVENKAITSDPDKSGGWGSSAGLISGSSEGAKEDSNWGKIKSGSITVPEMQDSEAEKGGNWNSVSQNACISQGDGWAQKSNWKSGSTNDSIVKKSDSLSWGEGTLKNENQNSNWSSVGPSVATPDTDWGKKTEWNSGNGGSQVNNSNWNSGSGDSNQTSSWEKNSNGNSNKSSGSAWNDNKNSNWSSGNPDPQTQDSDWGKKSNWNSGSGDSNQSTNWKSNGNWSTGSGDNLGGTNDGLNETSEDGGGGGWRGGYRGRGGSDRGGFRGRGFRGRGERGGGERGGGFGGRGERGGRGRSDGEGFGGRWGSDRGFGGRGRGRVDQSGEDGSFDGKKGGWNQGASSNTTSWGQSNAADKGQSSSWNESGGGSWGKKNDASDKGGW